MLKTLLLSPAGLGILGGLVLSLLGWLALKAKAAMAGNAKLAALVPLVDDTEGALVAAEKAAASDLAAGKSPGQAAKDAAKAAGAAAKASLPDVVKAAEAEVNALLSGPQASANTAGGQVVNLPALQKPRGIVPIIVVLIIAGIALLGGGIALVATGNGKQASTCVEQAASGNPAAFGAIVTDLSAVAIDPVAVAEVAIAGLGPVLGKCMLTDLWDDAKADLAVKLAAKASLPVAPAQVLKANAQAASVAKGFYPPGVIKTP